MEDQSTVGYGGIAEWEGKAMQPWKGQKCAKLQRSSNARQGQDKDSGSPVILLPVNTQVHGNKQDLGQKQFMGSY